MSKHDVTRCNDTRRCWALVTPAYASFEQPYWLLPHVTTTRSILRARLGCTSVKEFALTETRLLTTFDSRPARRLRYICCPIDGAEGSYLPETLHHNLVVHSDCSSSELPAAFADGVLRSKTKKANRQLAPVQEFCRI
jgi:hypothetical protein